MKSDGATTTFHHPRVVGCAFAGTPATAASRALVDAKVRLLRQDQDAKHRLTHDQWAVLGAQAVTRFTVPFVLVSHVQILSSSLTRTVFPHFRCSTAPMRRIPGSLRALVADMITPTLVGRGRARLSSELGWRRHRVQNVRAAANSASGPLESRRRKQRRRVA
jgi:hypothetical protein